MRRMIVPAGIAIVLIATVPCAFGKGGDVVDFKGGNRLVGEVKYLERGKLYFKTDATDTIGIEWNEVTALVTTQNVRVVERDGTRYFGTLARTESPATIAVATGTGTVTLPVLDVVDIDTLELTAWDRMDIDVSGNYSFSNATDVQELGVGLEVDYETETHSRTFKFSSQSSSAPDDDDSSRNVATYQALRYHEDNWLTGWLSGVEQNDALDLDYRVTSGYGGGRRFFPTSHSRILLFGGLQLSEEKFAGNDTDANVESVFMGTIDWYQFHAPELDLSSSLVVTPSLTEFGRVRAVVDTSLKWELVKDFYWQLSFFSDFDSDPQTGQSSSGSKNDYGVTTGIGWSH
jgi:hypothetical protein